MIGMPIAALQAHRFPLFLAGALVVPLIAAHGLLYGWFPMASDDSYIYLGYVKILLEHGAPFSYNPGEHSAGTTGLLYYYLLSAVGAVALPLLRLGDLGEGLSLLGWLVNGALFVALAATLGRIWRRLVPAPDSAQLPWMAVLLAAVTLHPLFFWGFFGGLENPLTAWLVLLLLERALAGAPWWQGALLAAGLACCRPELFPVAALTAALFGAGGERAGILRRTASAALLFAAAVLLLVLPCWALTGSVFPSAMGSRVNLPPLSDPLAWWGGLIGLLTDWPYLGSPWVIGLGLLLAAVLFFAGERPGRVLAWAAGLTLGNFLLRGFVGLTDFNAHDRYISYLWPLYVLIAAFVIRRLAARWPIRLPPAVAPVALATGVAGFLVGAAFGYDRLRADVDEMNQVVVEPARWMNAHLPPGSRIAMEPAGAIRLFTRFELVDAIGLTTRHVPDYLARARNPSYWGFLRENRVSHVFDYPARLPVLGQGRHFRPLAIWRPQPQRFSLGTIGVFQVAP